MPESDVPRASRSAELAVLLDLEASWENLRASRTSAGLSTIQELKGNQRAYEAFRARLVAYNKRYAPPHIPELPLNNPARLGPWCKKMSALFAELDDGVPFPANLREPLRSCHVAPFHPRPVSPCSKVLESQAASARGAAARAPDAGGARGAHHAILAPARSRIRDRFQRGFRC